MRVLIVDDHTLVRAGIRRLLEGFEGVEVAGEAGSAQDALDLVARYRDELFPQTPIVACGINDINSIPANAGDMNIIIVSMNLEVLIITRQVIGVRIIAKNEMGANVHEVWVMLNWERDSSEAIE